MLAEILNCSDDIKFTPEIVYPEKYLCIGRCALLEKLTALKESVVTVEIDGNDVINGTDKLIATCKESTCPAIKK